jgi:hypothetical protein
VTVVRAFQASFEGRLAQNDQSKTEENLAMQTGKVFFDMVMSLDGFIAPEGMELAHIHDPQYKRGFRGVKMSGSQYRARSRHPQSYRGNVPGTSLPDLKGVHQPWYGA